MTWISWIPYDEASGELKNLYDRIKGPDNYIDNILRVHSLRPHTLKGHMTLYKNVLHHPGNRLPKWLLEAIGLFVSQINGCEYCVQHHFRGMSRLLENQHIADSIMAAFVDRRLESHFSGRELAIMQYVEKLTKLQDQMTELDLQEMRNHEMTDGEILEVNQATSYFAYANRTVQGLGVTTEGDILGLSPGDSDSPDDWHHK